MDGIDRLLEEILVDAYGDSEQLTSFEVAFDESARLPFAARVVGANLPSTIWVHGSRGSEQTRWPKLGCA